MDEWLDKADEIISSLDRNPVAYIMLHPDLDIDFLLIKAQYMASLHDAAKRRGVAIFIMDSTDGFMLSVTYKDRVKLISNSDRLWKPAIAAKGDQR